VLGTGRNARRDVFAGRRCGDRSGQRRAPNARALEQPSSAHRQHFVFHHHAGPSCRGLRRGRPLLQPASEAVAKAEGDYHGAPGDRSSSLGCDYRAFRDVEFHDDEVALTCLGEGSTSQGEFWEALNTASNNKLPSSSALKTTATRSARRRGQYARRKHLHAKSRIFPNFHFAEIDGTGRRSLPARVSSRRSPLPRRSRACVCPRTLRSPVFPLALGR